MLSHHVGKSDLPIFHSPAIELMSVALSLSFERAWGKTGVQFPFLDLQLRFARGRYSDQRPKIVINMSN